MLDAAVALLQGGIELLLQILCRVPARAQLELGVDRGSNRGPSMRIVMLRRVRARVLLAHKALSHSRDVVRSVEGAMLRYAIDA